MVGYNIDAVIRVCGSVDRIVPHAKTHKSAAVLERQMAAGMRSYKCATLREAELLVEHGVDELIFAYPLVQPKKIERLARLKKDNPGTAIKAIVSTPEHLEGLSSVMQREGMTIEVYVDLDTGMRRTGVQPGAEAADFYATAARTPGISVLGVHVFDGHTLYKPDYDERKALVDKSIEYMREVWDRVSGPEHRGCRQRGRRLMVVPPLPGRGERQGIARHLGLLGLTQCHDGRAALQGRGGRAGPGRRPRPRDGHRDDRRGFQGRLPRPADTQTASPWWATRRPSLSRRARSTVS